jgi:hypothetical protein
MALDDMAAKAMPQKRVVPVDPEPPECGRCVACRNRTDTSGAVMGDGALLCRRCATRSDQGAGPQVRPEQVA